MGTLKSFVEKARKTHGDKYDYRLVRYYGSQVPITIICPEHGEFLQRPANHLRGNKCPYCSNIEKSKKLSMSNEEFIKKSDTVHGGKYDYSKTLYKNSKTRVTIICPEHGEFEMLPQAHLNGEGCPKCSGKGLSQDEIIEKFRAVHGDWYDYSKVKYTKMHDKVTVICPEHGEFQITPSKHILGHGCRHCGKKISKWQFIEKSKKIHGDKYDYSQVAFKKVTDKVKIICPRHGVFEMEARQHYRGQGCPKCSIEKRAEERHYTLNEFVEKAKKVHGDKYDYSKVAYVDSKTKVCIICPEHGEFWQTPGNHLNGCGCQKCHLCEIAREKLCDTKTFIEKAKTIHGDKYDYSKTVYVKSSEKVSIICPKHGEFKQLPYDHLSGHGCPTCGNVLSKGEDEIKEYLISKLGEGDVLSRQRNIIGNGKELDIYIPSKKIAIEYNGLLWHSERMGKDKWYHYEKMMACKNKGIRLIQVFEDEYISNKELVLEKISHILGISSIKPKIMGRKCVIKEISAETAKEFLIKNHIQGSSGSSVRLGAYYGNVLAGVMSFVKRNDKEWELVRFAGNNEYITQGVGGKIFKYFITKYNPDRIKSFADRRWSDEKNNIYLKLGFDYAGSLNPDYKYTKGNDGKRIHKFNFRKQTLHKKYGLPLSMTESEMTERLGFTRIWDCGLLKYVWIKKEDPV